MTAATGGSDLERANKSFEFVLGFTSENAFIRQDLETMKGLFGGKPIPPTTYVIFETGCAPIREQIRIPVPLFLAGVREVLYVGAAFPILKPQEGHLPSLSVKAGETSETTVLLCSMDSVIAHAFKNELPTIVTKTLVSALLKASVHYGINKSLEREDAMARLLVKLILATIQFSVDIADTRTWTTLPKEFQFCRIPTPTDGKLELSGPGGAPRAEVTVPTGAVNLLYVKSINASAPLLVQQITLKGGPALAAPPGGGSGTAERDSAANARPSGKAGPSSAAEARD